MLARCASRGFGEGREECLGDRLALGCEEVDEPRSDRRASGLPVHFLVSPANLHDAPFARPLLALAVRLYCIRPRIIRLDAASWGLQLIHRIHATLGAIAVILWNPKRQKNRSCLPPTWTSEALGKRSSIERFGWLAFSSSFICNGLLTSAGPPSSGR